MSEIIVGIDGSGHSARALEWAAREAALRKEVILKHHLCDPANFTVTVADGVVTLEGAPETASVGRDIVEEVRHVEGVVAVRDRLSYPPREQRFNPVSPM